MSAFKTLFTEYIKNDFQAKGSMFDKQLKVIVNKTEPNFLVADNLFIVPAYFTPAAVANFHAKFPTVHVSALDGKVLNISKWSLESRSVSSE